MFSHLNEQEEILTPRVNESETTNRSFIIDDYTKQDEDFLKSILLASSYIGLFEIKGRREQQEDSLQVSDLPGYELLSEDDRKQILKDVFSTMQSQIKDLEGGSTGNFSAGWLDEKDNTFNFDNCNLGDSQSYYVILNEKNEVVDKSIINKLHNPSESSEYKRIVDEGGFVFFGRINGELAVSRAFGDKTYEPYLSHTPEIVSKKIKLAPGHKVFIVTGCDGLTEATCENNYISPLNDKKIATILACHPNDLTATAFELGKTAYEGYSCDNISVAVLPVTKTPLSAIILDGHGGSDVSSTIGAIFYTELKKQIERALQKKAKKVPLEEKMSSLSVGFFAEKIQEIESSEPSSREELPDAKKCY